MAYGWATTAKLVNHPRVRISQDAKTAQMKNTIGFHQPSMPLTWGFHQHHAFNMGLHGTMVGPHKHSCPS